MDEKNIMRVLRQPGVKTRKRLVTYSLKRFFQQPKTPKRHVKGCGPVGLPATFRPSRPRNTPLYTQDPGKLPISTLPQRILTGARHLIRQVERDSWTKNVNRAWNKFSALRDLPDSVTYIVDDDNLFQIEAPTAVYVSETKPRKYLPLSKNCPAGYKPLFVPSKKLRLREPTVLFRPHQENVWSWWHGTRVWRDIEPRTDGSVQVSVPVVHRSLTIYSGTIKLPGLTIPSRKIEVDCVEHPSALSDVKIMEFDIKPNIAPIYLKIVEKMRARIQKFGRKIDRFPYERVRGKMSPIDTKARCLAKRKHISRCMRLVFAVMRRFDLLGHNIRTWLRSKIGDDKYRLLRRNLRVMRRRQRKMILRKHNICHSAKLRRKGKRRRELRERRHLSLMYQRHIRKRKEAHSVFRRPRVCRKVRVNLTNGCTKLVKSQKGLRSSYKQKLDPLNNKNIPAWIKGTHKKRQP